MNIKWKVGGGLLLTRLAEIRMKQVGRPAVNQVLENTVFPLADQVYTRVQIPICGGYRALIRQLRK